MAPPVPAVVAQGQGVVSADQLNTYLQAVSSFAQLRTFSALTQMAVFVEGGTTTADGFQGIFYYNSASVATDNGATVIVPTGNIQGAWLRLTPVNFSSYQTPLTGFSIQIANGVTSLLLNPAGTLAAGTIIFPAVPIDSQTLTIASSQAITALTLTPSAGQTILGALTTMTANGHAQWQYVAAISTWLRVS